MTKLLILGLDGATFDLVIPWANAGRLPTFARWLQEGTWAPLRSVPNMNTAPAWTTFMTGKNPGKHGVFWFAEEGEQAGTVRFVTASDRRASSIWRLLSDAGRSVVAVNVPLTYPAEQVNGTIVAGFEAPSPSSPGFTHPPGLLKEIERACGEYVLHASVARHAMAGRPDKVVSEALEAEDTRARAALHLMRTRPWDVFMHVVKSTDLVCHHAWEYGASEQRWMRPVYEHADRLLASFAEEAGPDASVMVMSDHGTGWRQPAAEYLNDILVQLGFLSRASGAERRWRAHRMARRVGPRTKAALKRTFPGVYSRFGYSVRFGGIDWGRTRAYCDNTRHCIWVNLEGRNPNGIVPVTEYGRLVEELRELLGGLVDVHTGEPVVEDVQTAEEAYTGPYTSRAPDLQIHWHYRRPVTGLGYSGRLGNARSERPGKGFMHTLTGAHRKYGMLLLHGPAFAPAAPLDSVGLEDLAPTILHMSELPVPGDMDGRVLVEALAQPYASRSVATTTSPDAERQVVTEYSDEEAAVVEERLRALGYL